MLLCSSAAKKKNFTETKIKREEPKAKFCKKRKSKAKYYIVVRTHFFLHTLKLKNGKPNN